MKLRIAITALAIASLLLALRLASPGQAHGAETPIRIAAASDATRLAGLIASRAERLDPATRITVQRAGDPLAQLADGAADAVLVTSWSRAPGTQTTVIGLDALCLVANTDAAVTSLGSDQVRDIYRRHTPGRTPITGAPAPTRSVSRPPGDGLRRLFADSFALRDDQITARTIAATDDDAIDIVAADQRAIAYVTLSAARRRILDGDPIRTLSIDGARPTLTNLRTGAYPFAMPIALITNADAPERVLALSDVARDITDADLTRTLGIVPLSSGR